MLDESQQRLVEDNINLVHHTLQHKLGIRLDHPHYEDLFQDGCIILCKCISAYSEDKSCLSTYVVCSIERHLRSKIRSYSTLLHVPRDDCDLNRKYDRLKKQNPGISDKEAIEVLECSYEKFQSIQNIYNILSLNEEIPSKNGDCVELMDLIVSGSDFTEEIIGSECARHIMDYIRNELRYNSERDEQVFTEWFCSNKLYGRKLTNHQLAQKYKLTQPTVNRIINKYLKVLKEYIKRKQQKGEL